MNSSEFLAYTGKVEQLVQRVNALADADARATALALLQSLMDLHGAVLTRMLEILGATEAGRASLEKLAGDPLICGLLVLYDLHPVDMPTRVARALEKVRPRMAKQGAQVELITASEGAVRVRVQSGGNACGNSPETLKQMVQQAVLEAAPEVVEVVVEGAASAVSGFVPLNTIQPARKEDTSYEESAA